MGAVFEPYNLPSLQQIITSQEIEVEKNERTASVVSEINTKN